MTWRKTREYRQWRVSVIRRDKVCVVCGSNKSRQAHHVDNGAHHPDSRFNVDNGVTLCRGCHTALHTMYKHSFRMKTTRADWENFLDLVNYIKGLEDAKDTSSSNSCGSNNV